MKFTKFFFVITYILNYKVKIYKNFLLNHWFDVSIINISSISIYNKNNIFDIFGFTNLKNFGYKLFILV